MISLRHECSKMVLFNHKLSLKYGCFRHDYVKSPGGVYFSNRKYMPQNKLSYRRDFREYCTIDGSSKTGKRKIADPYPFKLRSELVKVIRSQDFEAVMRIFSEIRISSFPKNFKLNLYTYILSACSKAHHLSNALEVKAELEILCPKTSGLESANLPLIRCYCDKGDTATAMKLIFSLIDRNEDLRLRTFNPLLEAFAKEGDLYAVLNCMQFMRQKLALIPRSEQVTIAMITASKNKTLSTDKKAVQAINDLLHTASNELLGLNTRHMHQIVMCMNNISSEAVVSEGVLVDSLSDIRGPILSRERLHEDGSVVALNASFATLVPSKNMLVQSNDPSIPIGLNKGYINFIPEKYQVLDEQIKQTADSGGSSSFPDSDDTVHDFLDYPFIESNMSSSSSSSAAIAALFNHPARLVDISSKSCLCPNCRQPIMPLLLTEDEKARVREALVSIAGAKFPTQEKHLKDFGNWLRSQDEFDYIVDGANIAYYNQNFHSGKFSFKQIEMVVKKLQEEDVDGKTTAKKRILVLLPRCYVQKIIPNNTQKQRKSMQISEEDMQILNRLERDNMLYVVPGGANDDWYWMYSTLYEGRKSPALVITNDLMRDHKLAFLEPRPFIRWRTSHIVYFGLSSAYTSDNSTDNSTNSTLSSSPTNTTTLEECRDNSTRLELVEPVTNKMDETPINDTAVAEEVYLYEPGKFSREIQYSASVGRWHVPSTDRSLWLCLNTAGTQQSSQSSDSCR